MSVDRVRRALPPSLALVALAAIVVVLGLAFAGPVGAATKTPEPRTTESAKVRESGKPTRSARPIATPSSAVAVRGAEVRFGEDVVVPKGTRMPSVVVFGGDVEVNGVVTDSVVAFGGYVVINGTVGKTVVAFGGDVRLGPKAVVGAEIPPSEVSLLLLGGDLDRAPGAQVGGQIQMVDNVDWNGAGAWAARAWLQNSLFGFSLVGWIVQTAFFLVLALVAAALMPRQLRGVQSQLGRRPWASLGWGALAFFIVAPAVLVVLVISIIGLLLVLPYIVFILLAYFFVTTAVAALLAQKVLGGFGRKENLMLAVALGVVGTTVTSRIPVLGALALTTMMVMGTGAAVLGVFEWQRVRRERAVADAAAAAAAAGVSAQTAAPVQASGITPIVQTSPAHQAARQYGPPQPLVPQSPPRPLVPQSPPQPPATPEPPSAPAVPKGQVGTDTGQSGGPPQEEEPGQTT